MHSQDKIAFHLSLILLALSSCLTLPRTASAQNQGNNSIYATSSTLKGSTAYIDAKVFAGSDICTQMNNALLAVTGNGSAGTVVDARGSTASLTCLSTSPQPWNTVTQPARLLLPAGTIVIPKKWIIPSESQVVGLGPGQTIVQVASTYTDVSMIQMGNSDCRNANSTGFSFAIAVLHLTLDGLNKAIDGIDNCNSEEQTFVDDVSMLRVEGIGLLLGTDPAGAMQGTANHSGPYSNIYFQANYLTGSPLAATACIVVANSQPRKIQGITCTANSTPKAAIYLDGLNVSVEDIRVDGFKDGVLVGDITNLQTYISTLTNVFSQNNLLFNIGGTSAVSTNLIHISNATSAHSSLPYECPPPSSSSSNAFNVCNLSIVGATAGGGTSVIQDDITGSSLPYSSANPSVAMYVLGQQVGNTTSQTPSQYSRFTTSPKYPSWGVGSTAISTITAQSCVGNGSLYSDTNGTSSTGTVWTCVNGLWTKIQ